MPELPSLPGTHSPPAEAPLPAQSPATPSLSTQSQPPRPRPPPAWPGSGCSRGPPRRCSTASQAHHHGILPFVPPRPSLARCIKLHWKFDQVGVSRLSSFSNLNAIEGRRSIARALARFPLRPALKSQKFSAHARHGFEQPQLQTQPPTSARTDSAAACAFMCGPGRSLGGAHCNARLAGQQFAVAGGMGITRRHPRGHLCATAACAVLVFQRRPPALPKYPCVSCARPAAGSLPASTRVRFRPGLRMCSKLLYPFICGSQACFRSLSRCSGPCLPGQNGASRTLLTIIRRKISRNMQTRHGSWDPCGKKQSDFACCQSSSGAHPIQRVAGFCYAEPCTDFGLGMRPRNLVFITVLALCHLQLGGQALTNALPPAQQPSTSATLLARPISVRSSFATPRRPRPGNFAHRTAGAGARIRSARPLGGAAPDPRGRHLDPHRRCGGLLPRLHSSRRQSHLPPVHLGAGGRRPPAG